MNGKKKEEEIDLMILSSGKKIFTEGRFIYRIGIKRSFFLYKEMEKKRKIAYSI